MHRPYYYDYTVYRSKSSGLHIQGGGGGCNSTRGPVLSGRCPLALRLGTEISPAWPWRTPLQDGRTLREKEKGRACARAGHPCARRARARTSDGTPSQNGVRSHLQRRLTRTRQSLPETRGAIKGLPLVVPGPRLPLLQNPSSPSSLGALPRGGSEMSLRSRA